MSTIRLRVWGTERGGFVPATLNDHFLMDLNGDFQQFFMYNDLESSNWNNHTKKLVVYMFQVGMIENRVSGIKKRSQKIQSNHHILDNGVSRQFTPLKANMSPENQWLEDVFPTKILPFLGHVSFQGCIATSDEVTPKGSWTVRESYECRQDVAWRSSDTYNRWISSTIPPKMA